MEVTFGIAFLAGLASFFSPCVFSLIPAYISYLSGKTISSVRSGGVTASRWESFLHGLSFSIGFSLVFISLGAIASTLGSILFELKPWLMRIGGLLLIFLGLHISGLVKIKFLEYDVRPQTRRELNRSYFSSALMGIFFSAGWSPCIGPVLGAILTLAMGRGAIGEGVILLCAYSFGLAIPFLIAALGIGWVTHLLRNYRTQLHYVEIVMGVVIIFIGILLFWGKFAELGRFGSLFDFGL